MAEGGRYRVRFAEGADDLRAARSLRAQAFRRAGETDADVFDAEAEHVLIEERCGGRLVCCFRMLVLADGSQLGRSYSAQFYELSGLGRLPEPMLEMGRFCIAEGVFDADVLRLAWGTLARLVEARGIGLIFGCSSFRGIDADRYGDAFALLRARHLAPRRWMPREKAPRVFRFGRAMRLRQPDLGAAARSMPPLLRSYLAMGGRVSDHAVVDPDLDTLHVFTGLEISAIPAGRARAMRLAVPEAAQG